MLLALLTEFLCSFASRLVAAVSEICKNTLQRLGNDDNKHGHLLRVSCDRHLAIFIFRVPFENSAFAANDITARDLISSGFRFSWRVGPHGLSCFRSRSSSPPPTVRLSHQTTRSSYPRRYLGAYCATDAGDSYPSFS
jgi:hypothetical protein